MSNLSYTIVRSSFGPQTRSVEYICNWNTRSERHNVKDSLRVHIYNRDLGYRFELEPSTCRYTALRVKEHGGPAWAKPARLAPYERSGKIIHHHAEIFDTGERADMFGYTARHVITKNYTLGDAQRTLDSECDGWYVDPPAAWLAMNPHHGKYHLMAFTDGPRDEHKFTVVGQEERGFIVHIKRTHWYLTREIVHHEEVTELSEAPLDPALFVPPPNFKRVLELQRAAGNTRAYRLRLRWELLKDCFSLPKKCGE